MGGVNPFGWRLFNLCVHLLNAWLIWWIFRNRFETRYPGRGAWPAFVCAAAFLAHPLQAQALASVSQRPYLMGLCFCLLTWICHARAKGPSAASVGFYIATHFCKETAVAGALFFWLWEVYTDKQGAGREVRALWRVRPYIASSLGFLALRAHVLAGMDLSGESLGTLWLAMLGFLKILPDYLSSMELPCYFGENALSLLGGMVVMTLVSVAVLRRPRPLLSFGLLLSFALLAPILRPLTIHAAVSDWFVYFAVVGFCMALGDFAFWSASPALAWVWGGLLATWAVLIAGAHAQDWRSPRLSPASSQARIQSAHNGDGSVWPGLTRGLSRWALQRDWGHGAVFQLAANAETSGKPGKILLLTSLNGEPDKVRRHISLYEQAQRGPPFDASPIPTSPKAPCSPESRSEGPAYLGAFHWGRLVIRYPLTEEFT